MRIQEDQQEPAGDRYGPDGAQDPAGRIPAVPAAALQEPDPRGVAAEGDGPEGQGREGGPPGAGHQGQGREGEEQAGAGEEQGRAGAGGSGGSAALVPARNEAGALPGLLAELAARRAVDRVLVVDNGSSDGTADAARAAGARVVAAPTPGYGRACQRGLRALASWDPPPAAVLILDADDRAGARQAGRILEPVLRGDAELVMGARRPTGNVPLHARLGNLLVGLVLRGLYGWRGRDVGPLRAARLDALCRLGLDDPDFGWNVQMQVRAIRAGLRIRELPVEFAPRRWGRSKISGSPAASVRAGWRMLTVLVRETMAGRSAETRARGVRPGRR